MMVFHFLCETTNIYKKFKLKERILRVLLKDMDVALIQENICKCVQVSHCSENYHMKQMCQLNISLESNLLAEKY